MGTKQEGRPMNRVTTYNLDAGDYRYRVQRWTHPVRGELCVRVRATCTITGVTAETTHESQRIARAMARERVEQIRTEENLMRIKPGEIRQAQHLARNPAETFPEREPIHTVEELCDRIDQDHQQFLGNANDD